MKYLFIILLFFSLGAEAQNYTFQKTDCRLEILIGAQIRYSMQLDELTWTNRIGGIEVKDGVSSLYCNGSQITNYTGGQVDSLILDLTTWRLACITRVVSDTLFIGSDTIISGTGYPRDSLSADADSLYWYQNGVYKDGFSVGGGGGASLAVWDTLALAIITDSVGATEDYTQYDFVVGSDQITDDLDPLHERRMFFDKSKSTFAAGRATGTEWDALGPYSAVFGYNCESNGSQAFTGGNNNVVTGNNSLAYGLNNNVLTADQAGAFGATQSVTGDYAYSFGGSSTNSGRYGMTLGFGLYTRSFSEVSVGTYGTDYTAVATTTFNAADRLFNVGNGTGTGANTSNAFTILKGGEVGIAIDSLETTGTGEILQVVGEVKVNGAIGNPMKSATGDGTTTIDWGLGNHFAFTFGAFNETFTFTAPTNSGIYTISLLQDGVGSRTATWPATVKWAAATAPTLTTTATTGYDLISFRFDGTNYYQLAVNLDLR